MLSLRTAPFAVALVVMMTALGLVPAQPPIATKHALLVRVNEYDPTGLKKLQSAEADMAPNLVEDEKAVEFEYVIDGTKQKGTCRVLTVDLGDGVKMELVRIKAGTFQMGSLKNEKERNDNEDRHEVEITKDFYLGKYALTQAQYKAVTGVNPSEFKGEQLPVETVSWDDAVKFCEKLGAKVKRNVNLPSEAQWEYACRAGTITPFHFGSKLNGDLANCDGNAPYGTETKGTHKKTTTEVGSYPANAWGLYDMHGNVWQWCRDYPGAYRLAGKKDPVRLEKGAYDCRIVRGGSWTNHAHYCRAAYREYFTPELRNSRTGFRVCFTTD